tara:strand:- start:994 stop:1779 length:786 start_codon:yes stop_codon:yes gene_type:complete
MKVYDFNLFPHPIDLIESDHLRVTKKDLTKIKDIEFKISVEIEDHKYNFPQNSVVHIHLHKGSDEQIFELGTWGNLKQHPDKINFDKTPHKIKYQIIVTAPGDYKYIGKSSRCTPIEQHAAKFFDIVHDDLGHALWSYELPDFSDSGELAVLKFNENITGIQSLPYDNMLLQSGVLPSFFREILKEIVRQEFTGIKNEESWHKNIFDICLKLDPGTEYITEKDEKDQFRWAEDMVEKFTETQKYIDAVNDELKINQESDNE